MSGDEGHQREKIPGFGPEPVHAGIELGLHEGGGAACFRRAGQFPRFRQRGEGDGKPVGEGEVKFRGQRGAEQKDRLPDAGLAKFGAFRGEGDAKLLTARAGKGPGHGNQAVAIGVVFDHGQDAGARRGGAAQGPEIGPQGGQRNSAPGAVGIGHERV